MLLLPSSGWGTLLPLCQVPGMPYVRERLTIPDVLEFLRMALEVPADEYLLLVPLIDKAHRTNGSFGQKQDRGKKVAQLSMPDPRS